MYFFEVFPLGMELHYNRLSCWFLAVSHRNTHARAARPKTPSAYFLREIFPGPASRK